MTHLFCKSGRSSLLAYSWTNIHSSLFIGLGFTLKDLESVPFGVALPIREAIYRCREQPCSDWSEEVCLLIGRQDLTKQAHKMTLAKSKAVSENWETFRVKSEFTCCVKGLYNSNHLIVMWTKFITLFCDQSWERYFGNVMSHWLLVTLCHVISIVTISVTLSK